MNRFQYVAVASLAAIASCGFAQTQPANHLVITELGVYAPTGYSSAPNSAEFTEIYNPTNATVDLSDYYISDYVNYFDLPAIVAQQTDNLLASGSDFLLKFPAGATLAPGQVAVVTNNGSEFIEAFFNSDLNEFTGQPGTPLLFETTDSSAAITDMGTNYNKSAPGYPLDRGGTAESPAGTNMSHTDAGEFTVLFYWDGQGPLVKDVDIVQYRPSATPWPDGSDDRLNDKSNLISVGPNNQFANYAVDSGSWQNLDIDYPGSGPRGQIVRRSILEVGETHTGGNGLNGDDETMEIGNLTCEMVIGAPSNGSPGLVDLPSNADNQPPVVGKSQRDVQNPAPGTPVNITVPVYDNGSVTVRLMVDKGSGYVAQNMTHSGNDVYTATITTTGMSDKARIKYYVEATDAGGLIRTEADYQSLPSMDPVYDPFPGHYAFMLKSAGHQPTDFLVTEVMYDPQGNNNYTHSQYFELYNPGASPLDLSYCRFSTDDYPTLVCTFPEGTVIPPQGYIIVAGNKEAFIRCYPGMNPDLVVEFNIFANTSFMAHAGSQFQFFDPNVFGFDEGPADRVAAAFKLFEYANNTPWPIGTPQNTGAGNTGYPIELTELTSAAESDPTKWAQSLVYNGTPLAANSTDPVLRPGSIQISNVARSIVFPSSSDVVQISATVASTTTPLANAKVYYSTGGAFSSVDMTTGDNVTYTAGIGPFADGSLVRYYVEATDTNGAKGAYPYIAPVAISPFRVQNAPVHTGLVLNEIMYDPASSDNLQYPEFIEIYNSNAFPVDLSMYQVGNHLQLNDTTSRLIPEGTIIQPNDYLVITAREELMKLVYTSPYTTFFDLKYGALDMSKVVGLDWPSGSTLTNGDGTTVRLFHPNEVNYWENVDNVPFIALNYQKSAPWPAAGTNLNAESIELIDPSQDIQNAASWMESIYFNGTPGARNSVTPPPASVGDWNLY